MTNEPASSTAGSVSICIECLLFGRYAELLEVQALQLQLPEKATAGDVVASLRSDRPNGKLLPLEPLVAVNRKHVKLDTALVDGDEVALLPPLAGG
jgi:molybdopterin converting factor small subunit